jgi:hypothetical protein
MAVSCLSLQREKEQSESRVMRQSFIRAPSQSRKLTRLKSPFGRLLHLFFVPECDFNLGYQSTDEVENDLEPERKPITAFNRVVAEVEENIEGRNGSGCLPGRVFRFGEESACDGSC